MRLSGTEAWASLAKTKSARWHENIARFGGPLAEVEHSPKFVIDADDTFFCIGSCFARNVEEHLVYSNRKVLSKRIVSPVEEWPHRINGFVNKFTTHSILNEIEWVISPPQVDESLFEETAQGWIDLQLSPGVRPVSRERAIQRRAYLINDYFARLRQASVVIITLGLNEVWHDAKSNRYLNATPSIYSVRRDPDRYTLEITDATTNFVMLTRIFSALLSLRHTLKIIVTVSPVPMSDTFSGRDVAIANAYSKATLRVAADKFAETFDNVDYFPTYDMISLSPRESVYGPDCLHISDKIVGQMMNKFLALYMGRDIPALPFNELGYLAANPDVETAARLGEFESGFEHWLLCGQAEGRPLMPEGGPNALMVTAGAV